MDIGVIHNQNHFPINVNLCDMIRNCVYCGIVRIDLIRTWTHCATHEDAMRSFGEFLQALCQVQLEFMDTPICIAIKKQMQGKSYNLDTIYSSVKYHDDGSVVTALKFIQAFYAVEFCLNYDKLLWFDKNQ